jgi:hypothetical protein
MFFKKYKERALRKIKEENDVGDVLTKRATAILSFAKIGDYIVYMEVKMLVVGYAKEHPVWDVITGLRTQWFNTLNEIQSGGFNYFDLQFLRKTEKEV